jgi:hypothetical protein
VSSEDDSQDMTPERRDWYDELFRLKDKVILLALREAEYFFEKNRDGDEVRAINEAVSDEFDTACHEYTMHQLRGISIS